MTDGELIREFQTMLDEHWRYEWGAAQKGCVDCSGAFVYAFRKYGLSIPHGSNAMARSSVERLLPISEAAPGMAAFKLRQPGHNAYNLPDKYKDGPDLNDYYHVGLVDQTGRYVLNAKSASAGFSRDPLSAWHRVGYLKQIRYNGEGKPMEMYTVTAANGKPVKLRGLPGGAVLTTIPVGAAVMAGEDVDGWRQVKYGSRTGYMMAQYLTPVSGGDTEPEDENLISVTLPEKIWEQLRDAIIEQTGVG